MFRKTIIILAGLVAALAIGFIVAGCGGLPEDAAAKVNGVIITKEDVDHRIELTRVVVPSEVPADESSQEFLDYRGNVTKQLVAEEMERQEAEKRGLSVPEEEIQDGLTAYIEDNYLGDIEKMQQEFADQGISVDDLRSEISRDLLHQKLLASVKEEVSISDEELQAYYDNNVDKYVYPEKRQVRQIVLADQASASQVASRVAAGEDFAEIAVETSIDEGTSARGGMVGLLTKEQLQPPEVAEVAFSLGESQVSQPFEAGGRWYIVRAEFIAPASDRTLDDLKEDLSTFLLNIKFSDRWKEYSAQLWEEYDIQYAEGYTPSEGGTIDTTTVEDPNAPVEQQ